MPWSESVAYAGKNFGGLKVMAGLVGGPRTPENFRKFAKKFHKKIAKMHYFSIFFNKVQNYELNSIDKFEFLSIFGKVLAKNRAFGNNTSFLRLF